MSDSIERRQIQRYKSPDLDILIRSVKGQSYLHREQQLRTVDFNRYDVGILSQHCFLIGDVLSLTISDRNQLTSEVEGVVCNRTQSESGYRCGIRFDFGLAEDLSLIEETLVEIESRLTQ